MCESCMRFCQRLYETQPQICRGASDPVQLPQKRQSRPCPGGHLDQRLLQIRRFCGQPCDANLDIGQLLQQLAGICSQLISAIMTDEQFTSHRSLKRQHPAAQGGGAAPGGSGSRRQATLPRNGKKQV